MDKNRNEFFYNIILNQLNNLKSYIPKLEFTEDITDKYDKSITIGLDTESQGETDLTKRIFNNRLCNFKVVYFERVETKNNNAKNIRIRQAEIVDLIEYELRQIRKKTQTERSYEYTHPYTLAPTYTLRIDNLNITEIWKTQPQNDTNNYYLLFDCELQYQQRLYN